MLLIGVQYISTIRPAAKILTESLLRLIRQQRHYGARIVISTQEPTIDPRLMDLCSMTLIHRFSSPEWFNVLKRHISMMDGDERDVDLFRRIIELRVGEGLLFAPNALARAPEEPCDEEWGNHDLLGDLGWNAEEAEETKGAGWGFEKLGTRFLKVKIRKRLTADASSRILSALDIANAQAGRKVDCERLR